MKTDRCRKVISNMIPDIKAFVRVPSGRIIGYESQRTGQRIFLGKGLVRVLKEGDLAIRTGISESHISMVIWGKYNLDVCQMKKVAAVLKKAVGEIF